MIHIHTDTHTHVVINLILVTTVVTLVNFYPLVIGHRHLPVINADTASCVHTPQRVGKVAAAFVFDKFRLLQHLTDKFALYVDNLRFAQNSVQNGVATEKL